MQIIVGPADYRIGRRPGQILVCYGVGTGIGLALYDPTTFIGGVLHYSQPDSSADSSLAAKNPGAFADTGIPLLIESMNEAGANLRRLMAFAVGGSSVSETDGSETGKRNLLALRKGLWKAGILLSGKAVPESNACTVSLEIGSGRLLLQERGQQRELNSLFASRVAVPAEPVGKS